MELLDGLRMVNSDYNLTAIGGIFTFYFFISMFTTFISFFLIANSGKLKVSSIILLTFSVIGIMLGIFTTSKYDKESLIAYKTYDVIIEDNAKVNYEAIDKNYYIEDKNGDIYTISVKED